MSAMYIACDNSMHRGYFLGDMLTAIKAAWMFVENEPHDHIILSLHDREPLNFLWDKFIADNLVTVVHDRWNQGDRDLQYAAFGERLANRRVKGIAFDTYKEIYPRLDGGPRQHLLCGRENGFGRKNIFCYYYFGQQSYRDCPVGGETFGPEVIDVPQVSRATTRRVLVAPHEKCHGNRVFTLACWEKVVAGLLAADIHVALNDQGGLMPGTDSPLLRRAFPPFRELLAQVAGARLVLSGNSGVGWLAGAAGTPLLALERNAAWGEYSFKRCGVRSLVGVIDEPDPQRVVQFVREHLESSS